MNAGMVEAFHSLVNALALACIFIAAGLIVYGVVRKWPEFIKVGLIGAVISVPVYLLTR